MLAQQFPAGLNSSQAEREKKDVWLDSTSSRGATSCWVVMRKEAS